MSRDDGLLVEQLKVRDEAAVTVLVVIPLEVGPAEAAGVLDGAESLWESGTVFQRLELRFRIGVVIRNMRSAVALRDL